MRLTLRTLLAYLDDLLEPSQAKELGAKVQESEVAAGLVMKIRDVIRKRRLTAPVVSGPGCDLDANIVAEYLDNTLPPQGVADLEQLCLDSEVHLAEVAASHQILTLVLNEPVDIGPLSRDRMYALADAAKSRSPSTSAGAATVAPSGNGHGQAHGHSVAVGVKPPVVTAPASAAPHGLAPAVKPVTVQRAPSGTIPATAAAETAAERRADEPFDRTIPEYLKAPPLWKRALPVAVCLLVVLWLGMLFSDPDMVRSVLGTKPAAPTQVAAANGAKPAVNSDPAAPEQAVPENGLADAGDADDGQGRDVVPKQEADDEEMPAEKPTKTPGEEVAAVDSSRVDAPPPADEEDTVPVLRPANPVTEEPLNLDDEVPPATKKASGTEVAKVDTNKKPSGASKAAAAPVPVPQRTNPAQYVSQDGVALHFDADRQGWYQLPHRAHVFADDALAVPEPFDAQILTGKDKHRLTLMGPAMASVIDPTGDAPMGINLVRGRVVLQPAEIDAGAAATPARYLLAVGDKNWRLELTDPATRVGIEVIPREPHQLEDDFGTANWSGKLYLWSGGLQITDGEGNVQSLVAPDALVLAKDPSLGEEPSDAATNLPSWERKLSNLAQKNARVFEKEFASDEASARELLTSTIDNKNYELSRLAVSCLGLVGDYEMMLEVLDRNDHYESRVAAINALRSWVNQSPENREKLKTALAAKFYPEEVDTVYRLIWGYQVEDARSKQTSELLVDWLEHDRLAVRELAWFYIKTLTNRKQEVFDARGTPMHIGTAVQRIRKVLERDGTLLPPLANKPPVAPDEK